LRDNGKIGLTVSENYKAEVVGVCGWR